jgi:hypothetical protein
VSPTLSLAPSWGEPTYHPTLHDRLFVLRGTIYYDRNANGSRDANLRTEEYGADTEYEIGLGGVNLQLVECDVSTNLKVKEMVDGSGEKGEGINSYSSTISQGYDVLFRPVLADRSVDGGKYNMINIKVNRAYYIEATAPAGYLFTGGVCNDSVPGWRCPRPNKAADNFSSFNAVGEQNLKNMHLERESFGDKFVNAGEDALGLRTGRSLRCVSVDRSGRVDGNLDLGAMKVGDVKLDRTEVRMSLNLRDLEESAASLKESHEKESDGGGGRLLSGALRRLQNLLGMSSLSSTSQEDHHQVHSRYLLEEEDEYAIGVIAAEVLAASLDVDLAANQVELDHISPKEVMLSLAAVDSSAATASSNLRNGDITTRPGTTATNNNADNQRPETSNSRNPAPRRQNRVTIDLEVWAHYPPTLAVDFDHIVQTSVNRQTETIRQELQEYNTHCDDQIEKVDDHGFVLDDFEEIYSNKGVVSNTKLKREKNAVELIEEEELVEEELVGGVFRTACSNEVKLPKYFEESLDTVEASKVVVTSILQEPSETPVMVIGLLAGLMVIMLIGGFLVFRMGFKKKPSTEEDESYYDEDTEYGSRSKMSYSSRSKDTRQRDLDEKMNSFRSGPEEAAPIPARPSNLITRELTNIVAMVNQEGSRMAYRFKFGKKKSVDLDTSEERHEAYARGDTMESADITKVIDDDHVNANDRIKDFERRMMAMKDLNMNKKEEVEEEASTASSRPTLPGNITFAAELETKNSSSTGKGSSDDDSSSSSSSSDSSGPVKKSKKKKIANKKYVKKRSVS